VLRKEVGSKPTSAAAGDRGHGYRVPPPLSEKDTIVAKPKIAEALNGMLAQEHACAIRYATHAAIIAGPYSETFSARLEEIGADELLRTHDGGLD
jgi:hypothetical protein